MKYFCHKKGLFSELVFCDLTGAMLLSTAASGIAKTAPNSFLFSLINPTGLKPTKIPLMQNKENSAILCNSNCGPVFGNTGPNGYYDLTISNTPNSQNSCQTYLNNAYRCPEGQNASTFPCGNCAFAANEIEIFGFEN